MTLNHEDKLTLDLLSAVDEDAVISQRTLASNLGIALGLTNAYLKRCAKKGLIKVTQVPANRYRYYLTPKGFAEKSRLLSDYLSHSFNFFRLARQQTTTLITLCQTHGWTRVALIGKSELTEVAILSATECGTGFIGIVDAEARKTTSNFMDIPVVAEVSELEDVDAVIITDMAAPQQRYDEMIARLPADRVKTLSLSGVQRGRQPLADEDAFDGSDHIAAEDGEAAQ